MREDNFRHCRKAFVLFVAKEYKFPDGKLVSSYDASKVQRQKVDDLCLAFQQFNRYGPSPIVLDLENDTY